MAYIPAEHQQYDVLPLCKAYGHEVIEYDHDLMSKIFCAIGIDLEPYQEKSYAEYFRFLDSVVDKCQDNLEELRLIQSLKKNIHDLNDKEVWSICRYVGADRGATPDSTLGVHHNGYYYWPCSRSNPVYRGVIDDMELPSFPYPADPELWEIIIDPTGMAYRTIYGKPEGAHAIKVRETETRNPAFIVPFKIYDAVDLQNGKYLIKDETGRFFEYDAERFEVLSGEDVRHLKKSVRYQKHRCPACGEYDFSRRESYEICRVCGWTDQPAGSVRMFSAEEHGQLYRSGKIAFRTWDEKTAPEGNYFFRKGLSGLYVICISVSPTNMIALSWDYCNGELRADGDAWEDLEHYGGNLWIATDFVPQYLDRALNRYPGIAQVPVIMNENGALRERSQGDR